MNRAILFSVLALLSGYSPTFAEDADPFAPGGDYPIVLHFAAAPMAGSGEVHPAITLKNGAFCDLMSIICLGMAERDYGPGVYEARDKVIKQLIDGR